MPNSRKNENDENDLNKLNFSETAFENVVYSYVDNLRQHSKRISEVNLLNKSKVASVLTTTTISTPITEEIDTKTKSSSNIKNDIKVQQVSSPASCTAVLENKPFLVNSHNKMNPMSTSSSCSSSSASISPKSSISVFSSADIVNNKPTSQVMSLKDKFESHNQNEIKAPSSSLLNITVRKSDLKNKKNIETTVCSIYSTAANISEQTLGVSVQLNSPSISITSSSSSSASSLASIPVISFSHPTSTSKNLSDSLLIELKNENPDRNVDNSIEFSFYQEFFR